MKHKKMQNPVKLPHKCPICDSDVYIDENLNPSSPYDNTEFCDSEDCPWFSNEVFDYFELSR